MIYELDGARGVVQVGVPQRVQGGRGGRRGRHGEEEGRVHDQVGWLLGLVGVLLLLVVARGTELFRGWVCDVGVSVYAGWGGGPERTHNDR